VFLTEKTELKKSMVTELSRRAGVRPLIPFYIISTLNDSDVTALVAILEVLMTDTSINNKTLVYRFAKTKKYQQQRESLYTLINEKTRGNAIINTRFQELSIESKKKVCHIVLMTVYTYLNKLHQVKSGQGVS
jgi:hypothetical protein